MPFAKLDIWNIALSHLGVSKDVASDTENSAEAGSCRRFYTIALEGVLEDFAWPFARKEVSLGLVATDPTDEWGYSYRYPADCVKVRRILSADRNDTRQSRVALHITQDTTGMLIYTDEASAKCEYTRRETVTSFFSAAFVTALARRLAAYMAPRLAEGDPYQLEQKQLQLYLLEISKAQSLAANEQQTDEEVNSEFQRARD